MAKTAGFDLGKAHGHFASHCFNATWDLIDKKRRSPGDDEVMVDLAHASFWHWTQRPDCTREKRSIGYWLLARVYALTGQADRARGYGDLALDFADKSGPFYKGFAHEALARAAMAGKKWALMDRHLKQAEARAAEVPEAKEAAWLRKNLASIGRPQAG